MLKTTTNSIEFQDNGVIVSRMKTRSGFKKVYIIEQANTIAHEINGNKKPLLIDLSKIEKSSLEEVKSLVSPETFEVSSAIAIVLNSGIQKIVLNALWKLKKDKFSCPIEVFSNYSVAEAWLKEQV